MEFLGWPGVLRYSTLATASTCGSTCCSCSSSISSLSLFLKRSPAGEDLRWTKLVKWSWSMVWINSHSRQATPRGLLQSVSSFSGSTPSMSFSASQFWLGASALLCHGFVLAVIISLTLLAVLPSPSSSTWSWSCSGWARKLPRVGENIFPLAKTHGLAPNDVKKPIAPIKY